LVATVPQNVKISPSPFINATASLKKPPQVVVISKNLDISQHPVNKLQRLNLFKGEKGAYAPTHVQQA
jgi:hypothetical protein